MYICTLFSAVSTRLYHVVRPEARRIYRVPVSVGGCANRTEPNLRSDRVLLPSRVCLSVAVCVYICTYNADADSDSELRWYTDWTELGYRSSGGCMG